ncbi:SDR family NAD(P)-dependent oxidoreductase [Paraburkholderia xenovorans]|nr:SDR family NAD(P)-dependent oxidoreductase [Paraburkholderia xenovorans]
MGIAGQSVLITGASQGIGEGLARSFAREGCKVLLVARSAQKLDALARELRSVYAVDVGVLALDMTGAGAIAEIVAFARHADVLVNNVGAIPGGTLYRYDEDGY